MRPYGSLWFLMGLYRSLCVFMDSIWFLWVLISFNASLWVLIRSHASLYRVGQKNVTTFYILTIFKITKSFVSYSCS